MSPGSKRWAAGAAQRRSIARRRTSVRVVILTVALLVLLAGANGTDPPALAAAVESLRQGQSGSDVLWVQARVAAIGVYSGPLTGTFGPQTEQAVRRFQAQKGIQVSGVVGPQTARLLISEPWRIRVQSGEMLSSIAARVGLTVSQLLTANPSVVNPNKIFAGQRLNIPAPARLQALAGTAADPRVIPALAPAPAPASPVAPVTPSPTPRATVAPANTSQLVRLDPDGGTDVLIGPGAQVYLTFDGPLRPELLPTVLEVLDKYSVPAAIFVSSEDVRDNSKLVKQAHAGGLSVQSAGWSRSGAERATPETLAAELISSARIITDLIGRHPAWLRPNAALPNAAYTTAASGAGQRILLWNNIGRLPDDRATIYRLDRYLVDGAVIRLPINWVTLDYLDAWLAHCQLKGVRFRELSNLVGMPRGW